LQSPASAYASSHTLYSTFLTLLLASLALPALFVPAWAGDVTRKASGDIDGDGVADRVELRRSADGISVDVAITLSATKRTAGRRRIRRSPDD